MANDMEKLGVAAIGILILVVLFMVIPMVGERIDDVAAVATDTTGTGTYTQSGISVEDEIITIGSETYTVHNSTSGAFYLTQAGNTTAVYLTELLVAEITSNSTLVTATDSGSGVVAITSVLADAAGNYATTENMTNGAFGAATMTGGVSGTQWDNAENSGIVTGSELFTDTGGMIVLAAIIVIVGVVIVAVARFRKGKN